MSSASTGGKEIRGRGHQTGGAPVRLIGPARRPGTTNGPAPKKKYGGRSRGGVGGASA